MSVTGPGRPVDLSRGADIDRTERPLSIEGGFGVNSRLLNASVGATRMLNNNFSLGVEGGVMNLTDYSFRPRPFVGANATAHIDNPRGVDPYVSARYTTSFGDGGPEHRAGGRVGVTAPLGDRFSMGMFVGADRALGTPVTTRWSTTYGMTVGFRIR